MCFKTKQPKLPPKPVVPTPAQSEEKASNLRRYRLQSASGRADNVLTSPLGASDYGDNVKKRRLTLGVS